VIADLVTLVERPECGVASLVLGNMGNAIRLHSASAGRRTC